jgi:hypothetical protein
VCNAKMRGYSASLRPSGLGSWLFRQTASLICYLPFLYWSPSSATSAASMASSVFRIVSSSIGRAGGILPTRCVCPYPKLVRYELLPPSTTPFPFLRGPHSTTPGEAMCLFPLRPARPLQGRSTLIHPHVTVYHTREVGLGFANHAVFAC